LDARGAISVTERTSFIGRIRELANLSAKNYLKQREELSFPLLKNYNFNVYLRWFTENE